MAKTHTILVRENALRILAKQKRKELWDMFWTILILTGLAALVIWNIITVISHHT